MHRYDGIDYVMQRCCTQTFMLKVGGTGTASADAANGNPLGINRGMFVILWWFRCDSNARLPAPQSGRVGVAR